MKDEMSIGCSMHGKNTFVQTPKRKDKFECIISKENPFNLMVLHAFSAMKTGARFGILSAP
jgi:hypothetical protein